MKKLLATTLLATTLATLGCGGSDSSGSDQPSVTPNTPGNPSTPNTPSQNEDLELQGIYEGVTDQGQDVVGLVTDSNELWFIYSIPYRDAIDGFVQGTLQEGTNRFTANVTDYQQGFGNVQSATVTSNVNTSKNLEGSIDYGRSEIVDFDLSYDTVASSANASPIGSSTRTFRGEVGVTNSGTENATVTIDNLGNLSGTGASGCPISGSVSNSPSRNYANVDFRFGNSSFCDYAGVRFTGVAYYDSEDKEVVLASISSDKNNGLIFIGEL